MIIGVLAVQGAFIEHERKLEALGATCIELRSALDCENDFDGLVLPGGESTVQTKLLRELGMFEPLKAKIERGLPVLATCAGAILLASDVVGGGPCFATMNMRIVRNAYGRQLSSFHANGDIEGVGEVPMTFIRAPKIESVGEATQAIGHVNGDIIAASSGNQLALSFHPELDSDPKIHQLFLSKIAAYRRSSDIK